MKGRKFVVSIGDLVADIVLQIPGFPIKGDDFIAADEIFLEAGGSCNFLIMLSRLGLEASAIGTIGKDYWGDRIEEILKDEGVDTSCLLRDGGTTVVIAAADRVGEHAFLGKYGNGRIPVFTEKERNLVLKSSAVFGSGYGLIDHSRADLTFKAFATARDCGIPVFFDPGPEFARLDSDTQRRAVKLSDCILLNEDEAAANDTCSPESLLNSGVKTVVLKRGGDGARIFTENRHFDQQGLPVSVIDTTAAGDCYDAAFIAGVVNGLSLEECASLANVVSAAKVKKLGGGRQVPTFSEIQETAEDFDIEIRI